MNRISRIVGLAATLLTVAAQAKDKPGKSKPSEWELSQTRDRRYQAELRAEANAPGMTKQEYAKVRAALAARKAREDSELARFEQYKFDQKLALAEASAAKTYAFTERQPGNASATASATRWGTSGLRTVAHLPRPSVKPAANRSAVTTITRARENAEYPAKFARRSAQEEGLDGQGPRLDAQPARDDTQLLLDSVPFGLPVPGRPGYMSSPPRQFQGYIDVRENTSGSVVVDPFTGQRVRVP